MGARNSKKSPIEIDAKKIEKVQSQFIQAHELEAQAIYKDKAGKVKKQTKHLKKMGIVYLILISVVGVFSVTVAMSYPWIKVFSFWEGYKLGLTYHFPLFASLFNLNKEYVRGIGVTILLTQKAHLATHPAADFRQVGNEYEQGKTLCQALKDANFVTNHQQSLTTSAIMLGVSIVALIAAIAVTIATAQPEIAEGAMAGVTGGATSLAAASASWAAVGMVGMTVSQTVQTANLPDNIDGTSLEC
jgi:hypothetical protein